MDANIIDVYSNYTINNATKYTELFVSKIYKGKPPWKNAFIKSNVEKIITDYYKDTLALKKVEDSKLLAIKTFLDGQKIKQSHFKNVLLLCIKQFNNLEALRCDSDLFTQIKILSGSILVAIELCSRANPIVTTQVSFREAEDQIMEDYPDVLENEILQILKQSDGEIKKIFNDSIKVSHALVKHYQKDDFALKFIKIKNLADNSRCYEVATSYNIDKLELTTDTKINEIVGKNNIREGITYIFLDKISYLIWKLMITKQDVPKFILDIPVDMLKLKKNIKKLIKLLSSPAIRDHIILRIEYSQLKKYNGNIQNLKKHQINVMVKLSSKDYNEELFAAINYLEFLPTQVNLTKVEELKNNAKIQFMLDYDEDEEIRTFKPALAKNVKNVRRLSQEIVFGESE